MYTTLTFISEVLCLVTYVQLFQMTLKMNSTSLVLLGWFLLCFNSYATTMLTIPTTAGI